MEERRRVGKQASRLVSKWAGSRWVDILDRQSVSWRARLQSSEWENIGPINVLRQANRLAVEWATRWVDR